jgi:hypothetical protein
MDRRGGAAGNGGMRDYVDPWAHNGNNGNSPMMGSGGPLNSFGSSNMSIASLANAGPNGQNNGGNFGSNMDVDKTSTQVTIPKDVSYSRFLTKIVLMKKSLLKKVGWRYHRKGRWSYSSHPLGVKCIHSDR